ncbi:MAG: pantoate--beta-alanine ligase [Bryobacteraceae bacterium]
MHMSTTVPGWLERRRSLAPRTIGVVATMGALHRGHASLVERCRRENEIVVVTIFVNPLQFNDPADLKRYPRTLDSDLALLKALGTNEVLMPEPSGIYPDGPRFRVTEAGLTNEMEGRHRPGFFDGVMTVVLKLLNLVRADRAYFGEKDYQQLRVIREMAADFFLPVEIVGCPTVRTAAGLAESSRNALLSVEGQAKAAAIFRALTSAVSAAEAKAILVADGFTVDYVEEHWGRRFAAASLEGIRLIDNVPIGDTHDAVLP